MGYYSIQCLYGSFYVIRSVAGSGAKASESSMPTPHHVKYVKTYIQSGPKASESSTPTPLQGKYAKAYTYM